LLIFKKRNIEIIKEIKQDNQKLKEKLKTKENQFEIIIYFLNKVRNLYEKTKVAKKPDEEEFLTIKNLTSDNLQSRLIELENFITNLKSQCQSNKSDFDSSKYMIENLKPFNDKIDDLSNENKLLRAQMQHIKKKLKEQKEQRENKIKDEKEIKDPKEIKTLTPSRFNDTIPYQSNEPENVFINNYQNEKIVSTSKEKENLNEERDKHEKPNNLSLLIPESIQKKIYNDIENSRKYEKPKPIKPTAIPKFGN